MEVDTLIDPPTLPTPPLPTSYAASPGLIGIYLYDGYGYIHTISGTTKNTRLVSFFATFYEY